MCMSWGVDVGLLVLCSAPLQSKRTTRAEAMQAMLHCKSRRPPPHAPVQMFLPAVCSCHYGQVGWRLAC